MCPSSTEGMTAALAATEIGINQATAHLDALALAEEHRTPSHPSRFDSYAIPAALTLPILEPRATKQRRREIDEQSVTLLNFVSHMTLNDLRSSLAPPSLSRAHFTDFSSPPVAKESEDLPSARTCRSKSFDFEQEDVADVATLRTLSHSQPHTTQWSLTTPETIKATISTPQARRLGSHKRKSPMQQVHSTPVDGNLPLLIPTLNTVNRPAAICASLHSSQRQLVGHKKAKSHTTLINSAPMLPASPDLENRQRVMGPRHHRFQAPCFSSPINGVTLVNPSFLRQAMATATPVATPRRTVVPLATAGLPSLDGTERSAPKWLRMKRRESLLCALRLAATES
jgi:hypothetical protein